MLNEFLEELKHNQGVNKAGDYENKVDIDYVIERLEDIKPTKSLNESIISIRVKLQNSKLKKSGKNKFAGFDYFELADFLPRLNELMLEEGVNDRFSIINNNDGTMTASLLLIKDTENQVYTMPFKLFDTPVNIKTDKNGEVREIKSMQDIQYLGALNTYYKRYLYLNAFGITDGEVIDSMNNEDLEETKKPTTEKKEVKASPKQIELIQTLVSDIPAMLNHYHIKKIEDLTIQQASEIITIKKGVK